MQRDLKISELFKNKGLSFHCFKDHVLFEKEEVLKDDQTPYTVFTPYKRKWMEKLNQIGISKVFIDYRNELYFDQFIQRSTEPNSLG